MFLFEVTDSFQRARVGYAIVGGYALVLHGIVRATIDVDLIINLKLSDFARAEEALLAIGLKSRLPVRAAEVYKMREEYIRNRKLIAWSFVDYSDPSKQVDIIITEDLKAVKTDTVSVGGRKIKVASLKDLLRLKKLAGRPQDLLDAKKIHEKLRGKN